MGQEFLDTRFNTSGRDLTRVIVAAKTSEVTLIVVTVPEGDWSNHDGKASGLVWLTPELALELAGHLHGIAGDLIFRKFDATIPIVPDCVLFERRYVFSDEYGTGSHTRLSWKDGSAYLYVSWDKKGVPDGTTTLLPLDQCHELSKALKAAGAYVLAGHELLMEGGVS
ncbi:MAG: hypothetical protein ACPG7F_00810 [Aggregatilineales bacterium]